MLRNRLEEQKGATVSHVLNAMGIGAEGMSTAKETRLEIVVALTACDFDQLHVGGANNRWEFALCAPALGRAIGALQQSLKADVLLPRNLARCVEGAGGVAVEAHEALEVAAAAGLEFSSTTRRRRRRWRGGGG